ITYKGGDGNDVAIVVTGPAVYTSTGGDLLLQLDPTGQNLEFYINGVRIDSRPLSVVTAATVNGIDGSSDRLTINYGNGFFAIPVSFHGGTGATDKLSVAGGVFPTVTHTFTTTGPEHSGNILYDTGVVSALVSYDGLEPVDLSGSAITTLIFNLPGAGDNAILEDDGTLSNGISQIRS